jgi:hypothetical protein
VIEQALQGLAVDPVPPRFEDGFMMLLSSAVERERLPPISVASSSRRAQPATRWCRCSGC